MPIFDQGYQHWSGKLSGHAWRWLAITRHGIRAGAKGRMLRIVLLVAWVPALALATMLALWGLIERKAGIVGPLVDIGNDGTQTVLTFDSDPPAPAKNAAIAAGQNAPAGSTKVCSGTIFISGTLTASIASRPN